MGHTIRAILGASHLLQPIASAWVHASCESLPQNFALIKVTDLLWDDINELCGSGPDPFEGFAFLSFAVYHVMLQASRQGPMAYFESDYFGGVGSQQAILVEKGELVLGPCLLNPILHRMGVWCTSGQDEFECLQLGRHRKM